MLGLPGCWLRHMDCCWLLGIRYPDEWFDRVGDLEDAGHSIDGSVFA